jgi:hypothetical protein
MSLRVTVYTVRRLCFQKIARHCVFFTTQHMHRCLQAHGVVARDQRQGHGPTVPRTAYLVNGFTDQLFLDEIFSLSFRGDDKTRPIELTGREKAVIVSDVRSWK